MKSLFHKKPILKRSFNYTYWIESLSKKYYKGNLKSANQEIKWLNEFILNNPDKNIKLEDLLERRVLNNEPLQFILGDQPFGPLNIAVKPPILIPRWETEEWTHDLANLINSHLSKNPSNLKIFEIGCGSGCISLLLSHLILKGRASLLGIDINEKAIDLSKFNKSIHQSKFINNSVEFIKGDVFCDNFIKEIIGKFGPIDLIVSNPPYIPPKEYDNLAQDVKDWEDERALTTRDELGLEFYVRMLDLYKFKGLLNTSKTNVISTPQLPQLVVEYAGNYQTQDLIELVNEKGGKIEIKKDLAKIDRVGYIKI